jgi:peptide/nickel transport system permease protein
MWSFLAKRFASLLATLLAASVVIFVLMEVLPGDPASFMLGLNASPDTVAALRTELGLDRPLLARYFGWLAGFATGDLGISYTYRVPVAELVADRLWVSLPLALIALALSVAIAIPAGVLAGARRNRPVDFAVMGATQLGIAVPNFWFAMLLVLAFAVGLRWFSAGGFPGWDAGPAAALRALTLPAIALALPQASILARVMRSSLLDTLHEDYMRTARAKGLTEGQAIRRHAIRNALIPVMTIIGLQFSFLLAGAIVIENVFFLPGLGRLIYQAVTQRDLIVVKSVVLLLVAAVVAVTFLVDLLYAAIDPRLRRQGR